MENVMIVTGIGLSGLIFFLLYTIIEPRTRENFWLKRRKLKENQEAWDNYCKNMTYKERSRCFLEWCEQRKRKTGNYFYWFPQENHIPPIYHECIINGKYYRGTEQEIIQESNMPIEIQKYLQGYFPDEIYWEQDSGGQVFKT